MPRKKSTQVAAAMPQLKAQGSGKKRTPQSAFDTAAGKDVYEPEKVIAQRTAKGGGVTVPGQVGRLRCQVQHLGAHRKLAAADAPDTWACVSQP